MRVGKACMCQLTHSTRRRAAGCTHSGGASVLSGARTKGGRAATVVSLPGGVCNEPQGNDSGQPRPSTRRWFELSHAREIYPACQRTELFDLEAKETQYGNIHSSNARVFWVR